MECMAGAPVPVQGKDVPAFKLTTVQEDVQLLLHSGPVALPAAQQMAAQHLPALFDRERLQCHVNRGQPVSVLKRDRAQ